MSMSKLCLLFSLIILLVISFYKTASTVGRGMNLSNSSQWTIAGHWFELARLPNPEQVNCIADDQITLLLNENNQLNRVFTCRDVQNRLQATLTEVQPGSNYVVNHVSLPDQDDDGRTDQVLHHPNADWLSYRIYYLSEDGQFMIIGSDDKQFAWIMARSANLDGEHFEVLMGRAKASGFNVSKMNRTLQNPENLPFAHNYARKYEAKTNKSSRRLMV